MSPIGPRSDCVLRLKRLERDPGVNGQRARGRVLGAQWHVYAYDGRCVSVMTG